MNKIVKPRNLLAFRIWLEKLGYKVVSKADGFVARTNDRHTKKHFHYILVVDHKSGNKAAFDLGSEFESHLVSPDLTDKQSVDFTKAMAQQIGRVAA